MHKLKDNLRAVLFDLFGTLILYPADEDLPGLLKRSAQKVGLDFTEEEIGNTLVRLEQVMRMKIKDNPLLARQALCHNEPYYLLWYRELLKLLGVRSNLDYLAKRMSDLYVADEEFQLDPETIDVLTKLEQRGLYLAAITNASVEVINTLNRLGLNQFHCLAISGSVGVEKPDRRIFALTLRTLQVKPHRAVFVGDSLEADALGAEAAGLTGVFLNRQSVPTPSYSGLQIQRLSEVLEILDGQK